MRRVGTVVRGIRTPIIKEDTNLADTVIDSLMKAKESEKFLITPLNESLIFLPIILNTFMSISPFWIIF